VEDAMGIAITFRHMASSESLKSYVHEKLERVQKYLRQPLDAHVTLFVESREHCAEAGITSGGRHYHGVTTARTCTSPSTC
jgi:putative sigma-54 modulation protein